MQRLLQVPTLTFRLALLLASVLFLSACASQPEKPEYAPVSDFNPFGYQEEQLDERLWAVRFVARPDMPMGDVENYALRRASEIAVANGKPGFDLQTRDCAEVEVTLSVPDYHSGTKEVTLQSGVGPVSIPTQDPAFPGYTREVPAKRCLLKVELVDQL